MRETPPSVDRISLVSPMWPFVVLLVIIAAALRLYQLDSQLWLDEVSALRGYRKPFLETMTTFPGFFPNPLYELMAHASLVAFGMSAWAIRLPAALFGVASVLVFYRLARRCVDPGTAALASTLFAVSYHHIFYSQDARGYTTYLFFALLSTDLLLSLLERMRWRVAFVYVMLTALGTYAHPFGVFVFAGHMIVALVVARSRQRKGNRDAATARQVVGIAVLSSATILALFAPLIHDAINYAFTEARTPGHGRQVLSVIPELLEGLRAGFGGWPGVIVGSLIGLIGTFDLVRRQPVAMALLVIPIVLSAGAMIALGAGVHPRYFILVLPIGYLVGTRGAMLAVECLVHAWRVCSKLIVGRLSSKNNPSDQSIRPSVAQKEHLRLLPSDLVPLKFGFGLLILVVACIPLGRYYQLPKQDYLGVLRELRVRADVDDRVVAAAHAGNAMALYYDPNFPIARDLDELQAVEAAGQRVWVIATLEREMAGHRPELLQHLHSEYKLVKVLPGTVGDGAMRIYVRDARP